jgi:acylphosphatase
VEVVAEGETSEVERLLDDIGEAMRGYIHRTEVSDESPTAEFGGFGVSFED